MQVLNSLALSVAKVAGGKKCYRPILKGVYCKNNKTVATDAYSMIEYTNNAKSEDSEGFEAYISTEVLSRIKIPNNGFCGIENDVLHSYGSTTDIKKVSDEKFPDYTEIIPTSEPIAKAYVNAEYLERILSVMKKCGTGNVTIEIRKDRFDPIVIRTEDDKSETMLGILMPVMK